MQRSAVVIVVFALLAGVCARNAGAQPHRVFVAREDPAREQLLRDLNGFIDEFKESHRKQLEFVTSRGDAKVAYIRFEFRPYAADNVRLVATFEGGAASTKVISRFALPKTQPLRDLLLDVLEQKLFDEHSGIYLPLPLARCEAGKAENVVTAEVARRNGIGLDDDVTYQLGEWEPSGRDSIPPILARAPVLFEITEFSGDGAAAATFQIGGASFRNFRRVDCTARPSHEMLLVPMLVPPLNRGARN